MAGQSVFDLLGNLQFDLSALQQVPTEIQGVVDQGTSKQSTIKVGLDDAMAQNDLRRLNSQIDLYVRDKKVGRVAIETTLDTNLADSALRDIKARIEQAKADLSVAADMSGAVGAQGATGGGGAGGLGPSDYAAANTIARGNMIRGTVGMASMVLGGATLKSTIEKSLTGAMEDARMEDSVRRVFGPVGDQMVQYTTDMSNSTKFLDEQLMESIVNLGDAGDAWGITTDQVKRGLQAITDVAHTTGLPQFKDDINAVTQAVMAGAAGRGVGLKKLGIDVSEGTMEKAVPDWKKMDEAQKSGARFNEMMKQLADIQGKAATDTQSAAYAHRAAIQKMDQAWDALGAKLMPLATKILNFVAGLPTWAIEGGAVAAGVGGTVLGTAMMFGLARGGLSGGMGRARGATTTAVANAAGEAADATNAGLISRIFSRGMTKAAPAAEAATATLAGGMYRGTYTQLMARVNAGALSASQGNLTYASSMSRVATDVGAAAKGVKGLGQSVNKFAGGLTGVMGALGLAAAGATIVSAFWSASNDRATAGIDKAALSSITNDISAQIRSSGNGQFAPVGADQRAQIVGQWKEGFWGTGTGLSEDDINGLIDAAQAQVLLNMQSRGALSPEAAQAYTQQLQDDMAERLRQRNMTENPTAAANQTIQIILQNASNTALKQGAIDAYSDSPDIR